MTLQNSLPQSALVKCLAQHILYAKLYTVQQDSKIHALRGTNTCGRALSAASITSVTSAKARATLSSTETVVVVTCPVVAEVSRH